MSRSTIMGRTSEVTGVAPAARHRSTDAHRDRRDRSQDHGAGGASTPTGGTCPAPDRIGWTAARASAGTARVSVQVLVTLILDERTRDEVVALSAAPLRPAWARTATWPGAPSELLARLSALRQAGVERIYAWFTDFATPDTLSTFGREVIAALG